MNVAQRLIASTVSERVLGSIGAPSFVLFVSSVVMKFARSMSSFWCARPFISLDSRGTKAMTDSPKCSLGQNMSPGSKLTVTNVSSSWE